MEPPPRRPIDLSGADLEPLLEQAALVRRKSLWHDARERLHANRPARWSLRFLVCLALFSLCAPLLPLSSPMALDLAEEPGPPELRIPWNNGWQHRISLGFRLDEPLQSRELLFRAESALVGLVTLATRIQPDVFRAAHNGTTTAIELALPYLEELDPARGSDLEARVRQHLSGRMEDGRLTLKNGGSVALSFTGVQAQNGYWELSFLDRELLRLRHRLFGFHQAGHWLGTDSKGRDLLARLAWGSRVSIQVALASALVSLVIGVVYGGIAGYVGGRVDRLMMRLVDALYSIPFLFVVIFVITLLDEYRAELAERYGIGHMAAFFAVLGMVTWLTMARRRRAAHA